MRILLLGASGRTGKHVLNELLVRGYQVICVVRDSSKLTVHKNLKTIKGDVQDAATLHQSALGCEVIINVLNISRTSDFPWSPLRTPKDFLSKVMGNILTLTNNPKVILCSAWGVAETRYEIPFWFRWLIDLSNIKYAYKDHERQEAMLTRSPLPWVIVRPVALTNFIKVSAVKVRHGSNLSPSLFISRTTLAVYLVDQVESSEQHGKKVVVST